MGKINPCVKLGRRIRYLRTYRGITQEQLAHLAGMSRINLSRIENGRQEPGVCVMVRIAHALGIKLTELVQGVE